MDWKARSSYSIVGFDALCLFPTFPRPSILHPPHTYRIAHALLLIGDGDGDVCGFWRAVSHLQAAQTEGAGGRRGGSEDSQAQEGRGLA